MMKRRKYILPILTLTLLLSACGGPAAGNTPTPEATGLGAHSDP